MYKLVLLTLLIGCTGFIHSPATVESKFWPDDTALLATKAAIDRWNKAGGLDLAISNQGMPIISQADLVLAESGLVCGHTDFIEREIVVTTRKENCGYWSFESLVMHEIGHALTFVGGHSDTGIMAPGGPAINRECIDENSLNLVCSGVYCSAFIPEC